MQRLIELTAIFPSCVFLGNRRGLYCKTEPYVKQLATAGEKKQSKLNGF